MPFLGDYTLHSWHRITVLKAQTCDPFADGDMTDVTVIGGGLAGSETAWQAAEMGSSVELWEMRPVKQTPAHRTDALAELVCSNSMGNLSLETASGLLKEELRRLESVIIHCANANMVPAGSALGLAREDFSLAVTEVVHGHPNIR